MSLRNALLAGFGRRRAQRWLAVAGAALAVAAAVAVPALALNGHAGVAPALSGTSHPVVSGAQNGPSQRSPSPQAPSQRVTAPAPTADETASDQVGPVPDEIIAKLADSDIEVSTRSGSGAEVSVDEAVSAACEGYPYLRADQITATLAMVTTHQFGTQRQMDPTKPSDIKPGIDHELVWIVAFSDVREVYVNPRVDAPPTPPVVSFGDVVQFITSSRPASLIYGLTP